MKINGLGFSEFSHAVAEVFTKEGSDKASKIINCNGHFYQDTYASQFLRLHARHMLRKPVRVAEVGVQAGNSMRAMHQMLPFAQLFGFDTADCPSCTEFSTIVVGDGYSAETWKDIPADFDLIIDDGSHCVEDMLRGIPVFLNHLRPGGVLMIEDVQSMESARRVLDSLPESELVDTREFGYYDDLTVLAVKK